MAVDPGHRRRAAALAITLIGVGLGGSGCGPRPPDPRSPTYYDGPTLPVRELLRQINDNNAQIATLWASLDFDAILRDPSTGKETRLGGSGNLLYRSPDQFRLAGRKIELGPVFDMGTDGESYWLAVFPELDTIWHGRLANVDRPCSQPIPVRPELVGQVLAVSVYGTNFLADPYPVMRFDHDRDAYVVVTHVRLPDRLAAAREVWYDRQTLLPVQVLLYDADGRALLKARLGEHAAVSGAEGKVAKAYDVWLTDSKSQIVLRLREAKLSKGPVPSADSFVRPEPAGLKQVNLDADCDQ